jgi:hypothetical protein
MLIIGINTLSDVTPVEGYSRIYKLNDSATFHTEYGYIASKEFMAKAANNDLSSINVYIYTPTFMTNTPEVSSNNKYIVTHADHVSIANAEHVEYKWHPISIK